jgi:FAD/FMN-containing dehydrogenase
MGASHQPLWTLPVETVYPSLDTEPSGLTEVEAIAACHRAGIKVTMVTGDYGLTAAAIAGNIGLVSDRAKVLTGEDLGHLSTAELHQLLKYRQGWNWVRIWFPLSL